MTILKVTNTNDSGNGSLRATIAGANAGDTIEFAAGLKGQTITLTSGELALTRDITIDGDIDGDHKADITISGGGNSRVFKITDNADTTIAATLESLNVTQGHVSGVAYAAYGGGIYVGRYDALTLIDSTVLDNTSTLRGGGIYGVHNSAVAVVNSTVADNSAGSQGGGIAAGSYAAITLVNATVSGNSATGSGGGIYGVVNNAIALYDSTVSGNYAGTTAGGTYNGGAGGTTKLVNSIVAGNVGHAGYNDVYGGYDGASTLVYAGSNILGSAPVNFASTSGPSATQIDGTNQTALETVFASVANDPHSGVLSGVLGNNGGPTETVAIKSRGIADGTGDVGALPTEATLGVDVNGNGTIESTAISVDQIGKARVRGGGLDIGAVEAGPVVTTASDSVPDSTFAGSLAADAADGGGLSLREAIHWAGAGDTITFDSSLKGQTITLLAGELVLSQDVTIDGDVNGDHKADITISGNHASRIFSVGGLGTHIALHSLTLTNGYATGNGGAIYADYGTTLDIVDSTISHNNGGGIFSYGDLNIANATFSGNYGGSAIEDRGGIAYLTNATITGNSALSGGGISTDFSTLTIDNSTISGNSAGNYGGGLFLFDSTTATITNSVIAGNTASIGPDIGYYGSPNTLDAANSFFGTDVSGVGTFNDNGGNQNNAGDPLLGPLGDHGGTVRTLALLAGSPLIDAGNGSLLPTDTFDVDHDGNTAEKLPLDANDNPRTQGGLDIGATQFVAEPQFFISGDFNGDGIDDIAWRNRSSGYVSAWLMDKNAHRHAVHPSNATSDWEALSPGDYNGDGIDDIAWRNSSTGYVSVWLMDKNGHRHVVHSGDASSAWEALAPGDFNGDGIDDIAWRNSSTGYVSVWLMDKNGHRHVVHSGDATSAWQALAPGDYNGDGIDDIAWRNSSTGYVSLWLMDKNGHRHVVHPSDATSDWQALAPGDYNGDGITDIAWRNTATGYVSVWLMDKNGHRHAVHSGDASSDWQALGSGDYNGDGIDDMAWRNTSTGYVSVWLMDKNGKRHFVHSGDATADWQALSPGDYNGDGITDIAWRNTSTGYVSVWQMDKNAHRHVVHPSDAPNIWQAV